MRLKMPPLNTLPAFEATARLGSMSAAAEELGRTHGAISKQIAHLNEQAGAALFRREGVRVVLTQEGEAFAAAVRPAMAQISHAWKDLKNRSGSPVLEIGISATFAMRWLMPRLPRFYKRYPEAQVNFRMTGRQWLPEEEMDATLTWDRLRWGFEERSDIDILGDVAFGIVVSPALEVEIRGNELRVPTRCVQELPGAVWEAYEKMTCRSVRAERTLAYPHTFLVIEAALAGFGAALVERRLVEEELADKRLLAPFGFFRIVNGFGAIRSKRSRTRSLANAFVDWVREEAALTPL
ncbi:LysR family transcriptional regulator [Roseibium denhamense]|uniref:Transcriptional regulator, LysR family n=2 Tax=Roseibium denhamense TaxID=76305 RepID=A0ABY1N6X7_9HYPH|nr:LysR substrate-binding domain-containing protein [Roseibium denhamense]MTI06045.1 LysR family transcriptional regulator [Roseibium denhamense]SMP01707.1 transcriptional regulator, LysR family [Roseibium denhamense]